MATQKCIMAGAGTGKTTYLLNQALDVSREKNVLYLTYTEAAAIHFASRVKAMRGTVPGNITVMTWYSFLLAHGVRPFPYPLPGILPRGISFVEGKVPQRRGMTRDNPAYYLANERGDIFSSRLADLACKCNEQVGGDAVNRISDMFDIILIDEAQDLSSYDYDYISSLMHTPATVIVVGDPRQRTYTTSKEGPHTEETFFDYAQRRQLCEIDTNSLSVCHRCRPDVVALANALFPDLPALACATPDEGTYLHTLSKRERAKPPVDFLEAMHLTWQAKSLPYSNCSTMTMGASKGSEFDDVAVWLTKPMSMWLNNREVPLKPGARAKMYVAVTRARNNLWLVRP